MKDDSHFSHRNRKSALESSRLIRPRSQHSYSSSDGATTSAWNAPDTNDTLPSKELLHPNGVDNYNNMEGTDGPVPLRPARIDPTDVDLLLLNMEQELWIQKDTIPPAVQNNDESRNETKLKREAANNDNNKNNWDSDDCYCEPVDKDEDADIQSISEDIQSITEEIIYDEKWNDNTDDDQDLYIMPPSLTQTHSMEEEDDTLESASSEALALDDINFYTLAHFLGWVFVWLALLRWTGRNTTTLLFSYEPRVDPQLALRLLEL